MSVLADPIRLRILTELEKGTVSPSELAAITGVELDYVARAFRQLSAAGYAAIAEERRAHRGGASVERIYREVEGRVFARSGLVLPPAARQVASHPVLSEIFRLAANAVEAGAFDYEPGSVFIYDLKALEEDACAELTRLLDDLSRFLPEAEAEARERRAAGRSSGDLDIVVGMTALRAGRPPFLAPQSPELLIDAEKSRFISGNLDPLSLPGVSPEMTKGLTNRWRSRILMELAARPMSPSSFVEEIGGDLSYVARCFRELNEWGLVEVAELRKGGRRGGGVERIYRNVRSPHLDDAAWRILPRSLLRELLAGVLAGYAARAGEAILEESPESGEPRHLSCRRLVLDRPAWENVCSRLASIFELLPSLARESTHRNGGTVEGLVPLLVGLVSFRLPGAGREALALERLDAAA
jgi:DNA-binding transcriptional ArsR family regulator